MARKLKIIENEKHPLDELKNDEITPSQLIRKIAVDFHFTGFQPQFSYFLRLKKALSS